MSEQQATGNGQRATGTSHTLMADTTGERLDVFLARCLPELSRAHAQRLIREGRVRINGAAAKAARRLEAGEQVTVEIPPAAPVSLEAQPIPLAVVYEDADLIVIDKPAGMPVHPGPGHERSTLVNALLARCPDLAGIEGSLRPGIVHRLDKDTSGLLVVAKNDRAQTNLAAQMAARTTRKEYLALVQGRPPPSGTIDAPIGRHPGRRTQMAVVAEGRPARTHFRSLGAVGPDTLVLARLETGRTHQIRVHFAAISHPIVGDPVYGKRSDLIDRQFLHAWRLGFTHPRSGEWIQLEAPPPEDLLQALRTALARAGTPDVPAALDALLRAADDGPTTGARRHGRETTA
jgi:23S rRNA pseudouridine1911/1915/1917 synthase